MVLYSSAWLHYYQQWRN